MPQQIPSKSSANRTVVSAEKSGHMIPYEQPALVTAAVREVVGRSPYAFARGWGARSRGERPDPSYAGLVGLTL